MIILALNSLKFKHIGANTSTSSFVSIYNLKYYIKYRRECEEGSNWHEKI